MGANERRIAEWSAPRFRPAPATPIWPVRRQFVLPLVAIGLGAWLVLAGLWGSPWLVGLFLVCCAAFGFSLMVQKKHWTESPQGKEMAREALALAESTPDSAGGMAVRVYFYIEGNA